MHATSHIRMRSASIRTEEGCIRRQRPARGADERRHVAESMGWPR
jgi:hypothetical protein